MSDQIRPSGLQPRGMRAHTHPAGRGHRQIRLGFPGYDPLRPCLHILLFDDSWSLASPNGNDPVAQRYREAEKAIRHIAGWTVTSRQRVATLHFDHPDGATGAQRLNSDKQLTALLDSLRMPPEAAGTSDLGPSLKAAHELAADHADEHVTLTVMTDWMLTDLDPSLPFADLRAFPGPVHAVALNAVPPLDLEAMPNVTLTHVASSDPPGMLAAAVAHSLTSTRRARRPATLRTRRKAVWR